MKTTTNKPTKCEVCQTEYPTKSLIVVEVGDKYTVICPQCYNLIGTCHSCGSAQSCGFANDRSEPQIVSKVIQKGMMRMQTQIKNPNLVQKHCMSCKCSDIEGNCFRENADGKNCPHYTILPQLLQNSFQ